MTYVQLKQLREKNTNKEKGEQEETEQSRRKELVEKEAQFLNRTEDRGKSKMPMRVRKTKVVFELTVVIM